MAVADPFLVLAAAVALVMGGSLIASSAHRRLLLIAYFLLMAATVSALTGAPIGENLVNLSRFLLAAIGMPLVVMMIARTVREIRLLVAAFVLSAGVAAIVGIADATLGTGIGAAVTTQNASSEVRFGGLTSHANHLGIVCAMSLPLALGLAARERLWQSTALLGTVVVLLLGVGISGSRAAVGGTIAGLIVFAMLHRRRLPQLGVFLGVAFCTLLFLFTGGSLVFENFSTPLDRLIDPTSTTASDAGRAAAQAAAANAFTASPVWGTGFQEIRSGLNVPLQIAASAGIIGVLAFLALIGTTAQAGRRVLRGRFRDPVVAWVGEAQTLAAACLASGGAWFVAGLSQNAIFDRYLYVPVGLVLSLGAIATRHHEVGPQAAARSR